MSIFSEQIVQVAWEHPYTRLFAQQPHPSISPLNHINGRTAGLIDTRQANHNVAIGEGGAAMDPLSASEQPAAMNHNAPGGWQVVVSCIIWQLEHEPTI